MATLKKTLNSEQRKSLLDLLEARFQKNEHRHKNIEWETVRDRLEKNDKKLRVLLAMEETGGEPDVIGWDKTKDELLYCDFSKESPKGRRSLCYDREAWLSRKEHKPVSSVEEMAIEICISLLTEEEYLNLQALEEVDLKTSSWVFTPDSIRKNGGALFCDRRYGQVFLYHNGAESYYAARGFRGMLRL